MTAPGDAKRLPLALLTFVVWVIATLFGMRWASDGTTKPLVETVTHGVSWNLVMAIAVLAVATAVWRWRDLRFVPSREPNLLKLMWFPLLYLVLFFGLALFFGLPPVGTIFFLALNTALVGLSEEWMFRGVIFQAWRTRVAMWPAIIITCIMFGSVHVFNVFVTGELGASVLQATTAALSGLVFVALLIRTGSIWVPIAYHALWDFCTFVMSAGAANDAVTVEQGGLATLLPLALVLPNFLYALYLLRKVRNDTVLAPA